MSQEIFQVDAFTDEPFAGNPAAVCILAEPKSEAWMQNVAMEMNLSETAFLEKVEDGYDLRWFTPAVEVELCGHATLASSHTLWETGLLKSDEEVRFHTKSGLLKATRQDGNIWLDFPANPARESETPEGLAEALGVSPVFTGKSRFDYLVEVNSESEVREVDPDFGRLRELDIRGIMVTSRANLESFDFVSRFFAPGAGVDEDPVTGSAHCTLGPHWSGKLDKMEMLAFQASRRGGIVRVHLSEDRVLLGGKAVTVMRGTLTGV
ncbi:MAG: PhzF family phenazine biosynthesis protein [Planctomycetota bacterium]|jgi:PhzF family phenazine biosynthesis protein